MSRGKPVTWIGWISRVLDPRGERRFERLAPALAASAARSRDAAAASRARRARRRSRGNRCRSRSSTSSAMAAARPRRRQVDRRAAIVDLRVAPGAASATCATICFGQVHHRGVIDIGLVELERGEFRVVARRQALVAEAAVDLEHLVGEPADHQPLQMQFRRDAQVEVDVERVVMGDEGLGRGAAGDRVQHRRLDFEIAAREQPGGASPRRSGCAGARSRGSAGS